MAPASRRYESTLFGGRLRVATALLGTLRSGYGRTQLAKDILAGVVVGIVALPLSMALAIATGVPPQHGLYTAIVAGIVIALAGGAPMQVSGPTAAFVVVLAPIVQRFGLGGLAVASLMAGALLLVLGIARLGRLIEFVPYPVTAGFTAGIAVVIATLQIKDALGLEVHPGSTEFIERAVDIARALPSFRVPEIAVTALTLGILLGLPRLTKRVPAPLLALTAAAVAAYVAARIDPRWQVATIGTRFSYVMDGVTMPGVPRQAPLPVLPWALPGGEGAPLGLSLSLLRELAPSAFAIGMLGAIESLLSAVVADGMARTKHDPDAELVGQGLGNIIAPFFGGFAATGAIARTATNIRSGAVSPVAAVVHAIFVLLAVLVFAPLLAYLPMAALAALLMLVAYNMSEMGHFIRVLRVAPKSDVAVQLACFSLTVVFDMVIAVSAGVMLAALLFMRRMAEISQAKLIGPDQPSIGVELPDGVVLYEIAGPLFFGAAHKAMSALHSISNVRAVVLDLRGVPALDVTGLVNLESSLQRLRQMKAMVALVGLQKQPAGVLERAHIEPDGERLIFCKTLGEALSAAGAYVPPPPSSRGAISRRGA